MANQVFVTLFIQQSAAKILMMPIQQEKIVKGMNCRKLLTIQRRESHPTVYKKRFGAVSKICRRSNRHLPNHQPQNYDRKWRSRSLLKNTFRTRLSRQLRGKWH